MENLSLEVQAMDKVYSIENVQFQKLDLNLGGTPQFSIRLTLAQDNLLTEDMIGIEILEKRNIRTICSTSLFLIQLFLENLI